MNSLKTPFLVLAVILAVVVVLLELGSSHLVGGGGAGGQVAAAAQTLGATVGGPTSQVRQPPGRAISYLALVDVALAYTIGLMGLSLVVPLRLQARVQGVATLIGSIVLLIVAIVAAVIAVVELLVMISLFLSVPFGTIAYLAVWGFFPRGEAAVVLSLLLLVKLVTGLFLVLAQPAFLKQKGLVALVLTSLVLNVVVAFLHGLVPIVVVSIVDDIAAIVTAVVAIVWALVLLVGSIPAIVAAVRVGKG